MVKQLLHEWKKKTGGYIKKDKKGLYEDDYYLIFPDDPARNTHIHLVINNFQSKFVNSNSNPPFQLIPTTTIGYVVKKDTKHLQPIKIDETDSPDKICLHMIKLYENFDMNYYNSK